MGKELQGDPAAETTGNYRFRIRDYIGVLA
jgi:hypothetical protein